MFSTKRSDLLKFIRFTMHCAALYSFHLEHYMPSILRNLGIFLELLIELFLHFVTIHILILYMCTIYVNYHSGDLELFVNCLIQTIIYWWVIMIKLYFRRLRNKKLNNLCDFLNFNYKIRSAIGFTYVTMNDCLTMSNKWIKCYVYWCFIGTLFWLCLPIAYGDHSLPLNCWYPFDYKQPIVYECMYFLQFVGQIQVASAFASSSGLHMVLSILISGQYDVLYCSLKNIIATVAINTHSTRRDLKKLYKLQEFSASETNEFYCSTEITCKIDKLMLLRKGIAKNQNFHIEFHKAIKSCVEHHRFILKFLNQMEDFYCPLWFFKTGQVILLMCLVAFVSVKSTTANSSFIKILSLGQYLFLATWELLIICYFGEIVYANSQRCGEAILRSPWNLYTREMKLNFLLFLLNANTPFKLTAGKLLTLNTELFKNMITTTFSFLTLLQKMDQRI